MKASKGVHRLAILLGGICFLCSLTFTFILFSTREANYIQLSESDRQRLDGIVRRMVANRESDAAIQAVVNDFKQKYGRHFRIAPIGTREHTGVKEMENLRAKYPDYDDLTDYDLATRLAGKFREYSALPDKILKAETEIIKRERKELYWSTGGLIVLCLGSFVVPFSLVHAIAWVIRGFQEDNEKTKVSDLKA